MTFDKLPAIQEALRLVNLSQRLASNPDKARKGGFLTVGLNGFRQTFVHNIGQYPLEKADKYSRISQEKAHRLFAHYLRQPDIAVSSWQTRSSRAEDLMPGGAVLFPSTVYPDIVSFSGLAEHTDEAVSLVFGLNMGLSQDLDYASRVAAISNNLVFGELYEASRRAA